jgi:hypothetical protein
MLKITKSTSDFLRGAFLFRNHGQVTIFDTVFLTTQGDLMIQYQNNIASVLEPELVKEATQLMIEHGIVITNETDRVDV